MTTHGELLCRVYNGTLVVLKILGGRKDVLATSSCHAKHGAESSKGLHVELEAMTESCPFILAFPFYPIHSRHSRKVISFLFVLHVIRDEGDVAPLSQEGITSAGTSVA